VKKRHRKPVCTSACLIEFPSKLSQPPLLIRSKESQLLASRPQNFPLPATSSRRLRAGLRVCGWRIGRAVVRVVRRVRRMRLGCMVNVTECVEVVVDEWGGESEVC